MMSKYYLWNLRPEIGFERRNMENIQLFEDSIIRTAWDEEKEEWYFSIIDVIAVLTEVENPRRYWSDLKRKRIYKL